MLDGKYDVKREGKLVEDAEVYFARRAAAYLVLNSGAGQPLLIRPRTRSVEGLRKDDLLRHESRTCIDIAADAKLTRLARQLCELRCEPFRARALRGRTRFARGGVEIRLLGPQVVLSATA